MKQSLPEQGVQKLESLELLRFIAAFGVVLFHTTSIFHERFGVTPFLNIFRFGDRGVDLFFVLSGFIITLRHAGDVGRPERLTNYLFSRFSRIFPAVWVMTALAALMYAAGFGGADKADKLSLGNFITSALLLPQANARLGSALVNVSWTLKYEMFFYLIFSISIINKRIGVIFFILWQLLVVLVGVFNPQIVTKAYGLYFSSLCLEFLIGIAAALLISNYRVRLALSSAVSQSGLLILGGLAIAIGVDLAPVSSSAGIGFAIGSGLLIFSLALLERSARISIAKPFVHLGGASYAIYLVHYSVISAGASLVQRFMPLSINSGTALVLALSGIGVGIVFDLIIDKPAQKILKLQLRPRLLPELARKTASDELAAE